MHRIVVAVALAVSALLVRAEEQAPAEVHIAFDDKGLHSLTSNGLELLESGELRIDHAEVSDEKHENSNVELKAPKVVVDPAAGTVSQTWDFARIETSFASSANKVDITVKISNLSSRTISALSLTVLTMRFPQTPADYGTIPRVYTNLGAPTIVKADFGAGVLAVCNEDFYRPLHLGFPWPVNQKKTCFPLIADTGRRKPLPDSAVLIDRPIYPGTDDVYRISLRFGNKGADEWNLAADLVERYRKTFPFELHWDDRRPIGALFVASSRAGFAKNPRGWLLDPKIDTTTPEGREEFHAKLLTYADNSVKVLKDMDAQGAIVWDSEGQEFPHATSYIGDPRSLPPEMEDVADAFFEKFKKAGFRVGVCVRPTLPLRRAYSEGVNQYEIADVARNIIEKIEAARKRWGCSIFYVDSNVDHDQRGRVIHDALLFRKIAKAFPDCLLIPEHANVLHYAYTAPYKEVRLGNFSAPADARRVYPDAFSVLYVADGPIDEHRDQLVKAVKNGDILLFRGWWDDPFNVKAKSIIQDAKK